MLQVWSVASLFCLRMGRQILLLARIHLVRYQYYSITYPLMPQYLDVTPDSISRGRTASAQSHTDIWIVSIPTILGSDHAHHHTKHLWLSAKESVIHLHENYMECSSNFVLTEWPAGRHARMMEEVRCLSADIVTMQEIECDHYYDVLKPDMQQLGYDGVHYLRCVKYCEKKSLAS